MADFFHDKGVTHNQEVGHPLFQANRDFRHTMDVFSYEIMEKILSYVHDCGHEHCRLRNASQVEIMTRVQRRWHKILTPRLYRVVPLVAFMNMIPDACYKKAPGGRYETRPDKCIQLKDLERFRELSQHVKVILIERGDGSLISESLSKALANALEGVAPVCPTLQHLEISPYGVRRIPLEMLKTLIPSTIERIDVPRNITLDLIDHKQLTTLHLAINTFGASGVPTPPPYPLHLPQLKRLTLDTCVNDLDMVLFSSRRIFNIADLNELTLYLGNPQHSGRLPIADPQRYLTRLFKDLKTHGLHDMARIRVNEWKIRGLYQLSICGGWPVNIYDGWDLKAKGNRIKLINFFYCGCEKEGGCEPWR